MTFSYRLQKNPGHNKFDYPDLNHLCLTCEYKREHSQCPFNDLSEAARSGHLSFMSCKEAQFKLKSLFQLNWPCLRYLNLWKSELSETDLEVLSLACNGPEKTLHILTLLFLSIPNEMTEETLSSNFFALPWVNLRSFYIDCRLSKVGIHDSLCDAIVSGKLENLTSLVIQVRPGLTRDEQMSVKLPCVEKLRNLKSLRL